MTKNAPKTDLHRNSSSPSFARKEELPGVSLSIKGAAHSYGQIQVLRDFSLDVGAGEIVSLLGPSGCGKTTMLRIIAGFVRQDKGQVLVDGKRIGHLPANRRHVGMVFQNYALFRHLTGRENISYGLLAQRQLRRTIRQRGDEVLGLVKLSDYDDRLSGEQQHGNGPSSKIQAQLDIFYVMVAGLFAVKCFFEHSKVTVPEPISEKPKA